MTRDEAERVSIALLRAASRLVEASLVMDAQDFGEKWEQYRRAIDWTTMAVSLGLCKPLWTRYPELRPDIFGGPFRIDPSIHEIQIVLLKELACDFSL